LYSSPRDFKIGLTVKNSIDIYESGYVKTPRRIVKKESFSMPVSATLGFSMKKGKYLFSCDNEVIHGDFGGVKNKTARFWMLRIGAEREILSRFFLRAGIIVPVEARTSTLGDLRDNLPEPKFGGAIGAGAIFGPLKADLAITGDAAKSYMEQSIHLKAIGSLSLSF